MNQWHPAPRAMIDDELMRVWTKDNPAPDLVIHMILTAKLHAGSPWGLGKLMRFSGLSKHYARQAIKRAEDWLGEWENIPKYPTDAPAEMHPVSNNGEDLHGQNGREYPKKSQNLPSRARSINTDTEQYSTDPDRQGQIAPVPAAQDKGIPKDDISAMWATMCGIRADVFPGSQRVLALLPARDQKLRACLRIQKLTPDDLVHLTRWFFTADENQWVRDKGYHFDTMLRPANVARYYEKAQGWSAARDEADTERRLAEGY